MRLVFDTEGNGLLHDTPEAPAITKMHCIVTHDVDTGAVYKFYGDKTVVADHGSLQTGLEFIQRADELIGHNIIGYDVPAIRKLFGIDLRKVTLTDTLVLSKALNADRVLPKGMPSPINPLTGKAERYGPHSLGTWGFRLGRFKPEWHDWKEFSLGMLHRCAEDVEINVLVYQHLLGELAEIMNKVSA